jgi:hypothetical protein
VSVPWQLLGVVDRGRRLEIGYTGAGCRRMDHVDVAEHPTGVRIAVWERDTSGRHRACPQYLTIARKLVILNAPLGDRRLTHGPVTAP